MKFWTMRIAESFILTSTALATPSLMQSKLTRKLRSIPMSLPWLWLSKRIVHLPKVSYPSSHLSKASREVIKWLRDQSTMLSKASPSFVSIISRPKCSYYAQLSPFSSSTTERKRQLRISPTLLRVSTITVCRSILNLEEMHLSYFTRILGQLG